MQRSIAAHRPDESRGETFKASNSCDTSFSVGSLSAARRAAGAVKTAVDRVLRGRSRNAFCVVRPPGHHAGVSGLLADASSHGFCIFNSVAAGGLHALEAAEHKCQRVAIIGEAAILACPERRVDAVVISDPGTARVPNDHAR